MKNPTPTILKISCFSLALILAFNCALANNRNERPVYPEIIRGTWQGGRGPCHLSGDTDSDSRIVIDRTKIRGYEDSSDLVHIEKISSKPIAWKIHSKLDIGDSYLFDVHDIYVLGGKHLTIIDDRALPSTYTLCE